MEEPIPKQVMIRKLICPQSMSAKLVSPRGLLSMALSCSGVLVVSEELRSYLFSVCFSVYTELGFDITKFSFEEEHIMSL